MKPAPVLPAALALALLGPGASAADEVAQTIGAWTVTCQIAAGGRACELRNDEDDKPAAEQQTLLSFALRAGQDEALGLVRVAAFELPPRLEVELAFGSEIVNVEGVGSGERLAARFAIPRRELPDLAGPEAARLRFTDQKGQVHEIPIPMTGFAQALALAARHL